MKWLFAFFCFASLQAVEGQPSQYGAVTIESLDAVGLIRMNGTTVSQGLKVTGSLIAQNAMLQTLNIVGEANLTGTKIKQESFVLGSLQATRSQFEQTLTVHSQKALFTACKLQGITVKQDSGFKGRQIIELKQGTVVQGPIHFESGKGEVVVFSGCQVLGAITGGKLVKK
jgi:hypothetical protein